MPAPFTIIGIDHVVLRASDPEALERFYMEVLGCAFEKRQGTLTQLRAGHALSRRTSGWVMGGAGRESYLVGGAVQSLKTLTGAAGIRYNAGSGTTLRLDVSVIRHLAPPKP